MITTKNQNPNPSKGEQNNSEADQTNSVKTVSNNEPVDNKIDRSLMDQDYSDMAADPVLYRLDYMDVIKIAVEGMNPSWAKKEGNDRYEVYYKSPNHELAEALAVKLKKHKDYEVIVEQDNLQKSEWIVKVTAQIMPYSLKNLSDWVCQMSEYGDDLGCTFMGLVDRQSGHRPIGPLADFR
jgi:hypothetical protein